jgi:thermitase
MFVLCASLSMVPITSAAENTLPLGFIADLNAQYGHLDSSPPPALGSASPRWDLIQIKAPEAWPVVSGGKDVVVAILDTGIDAEHYDLQNKVINKSNFTASDGIDTARGHGTAIAGIIAGAIDNTGISGLAYNSLLLDVRVAENDGTTDALKVAKGIIWAVDHGAKIINVSIVVNKPYPLLELAADYAWRKDCLIVAAAGNNFSTDPVYPAAYPHVISVAASDKADLLAGWSNHGEWVNIAAPGVDIYSTLPGNSFGFKNGSSFSSALVSGEAALLYIRAVDTNDDGRVNDEISEMILNKSDKLEALDHPDRRINVYKAAISENLANTIPID